jgi:hypothetical protein
MKGGRCMLFRDKSGKLSSIRIMSWVALVMAIFITVRGMFNGIYHTTNVVAADNFKFLLSAWLVGAFAPKAVQKFAERELKIKNTTGGQDVNNETN